MKEQKEARSRWLTIRLSEAEEAKLHKLMNRTTSGSLSEYARAFLLKEPVIVIYRNVSADDFLTEMIGLKSELVYLIDNFYKPVQKVHAFDHATGINTAAVHDEQGKKLLMKGG